MKVSGIELLCLFSYSRLHDLKILKSIIIFLYLLIYFLRKGVGRVGVGADDGGVEVLGEGWRCYRRIQERYWSIGFQG